MSVDLAETIETIPIKQAAEYSYCPRAFYLMYVAGEFVDNDFTKEGSVKHRQVDEPSMRASRNGTIKTAIEIAAPFVGVHGKLDMVEYLSDGTAAPIECKRGSIPEDGPSHFQRVHVCLQALALEENGAKCNSAAIFYYDSHRRADVELTDELRNATLETVQLARDCVRNELAPESLVNSEKCVGCSLNSICLPDEINNANSKTEASVVRILSRDPNTHPVYVTTPGAHVGFSSGRFTVKMDGKIVDSFREIDVSHVVLFGTIQISTAAVHRLLERGGHVVYLTRGGWMKGIASGNPSRNAYTRLGQYKHLDDLEVCRTFVRSKIRNARTLLRRNGKDNKTVLAELKKLSDLVSCASKLDELLGIEGAAARSYFSVFTSMFTEGLDFEVDFEGRNRRPPKDPVNAMMSFLYSMLIKDLTIACLSAGLDPYIGAMHRPKHGKPALALDLAEEFRAVVCDSALLNLLNRRIVDEDDFETRGLGILMKDGCKKKVVRAYESRIEVSVKHPVYGYSVTYRRLFETQARMLGAYFREEVPKYLPFEVR